MRPLTSPSRATRQLTVALCALVGLGLAGCGQSGAPAGAASSATSAPGAASTSTATPHVDALVAPRGEAPAPSASRSTAPEASSQPAPAGAADAVPAPQGSVAAVAAGLRPASISVPSIGVSSSLVDLGIASDGSIEVPQDAAQAGWLDRGPAPGQQGPAVIAGHVDSKTGPAVFYHLRELKVGDPIVVTRRDGSRVTFTVDGVQTYLKSQFPTEATYGPVPGPALRLITCGGSYVKSEGGYQSNVVVFAS